MPIDMLDIIKTLFHTLIAFLCLFFSIFLLTRANGRRKANAWLAGFLLTQLVLSLAGILAHFPDLRAIAWRAATWLFYVDEPFNFLLYPLLFFYVLSLTRDSFSFRLKHIAHFIPFLFVAGLTIWSVASTPADALRELIRTGTPIHPAISNIKTAGYFLQAFGYLAAGFVILSGYRRRIKGLYSAIEKINLSWLTLVLAGLAVALALDLINYFVWRAGWISLAIGIYILIEIVFLSFVSLMFYKGLTRPEIFAGPSAPEEKPKYEKTLLPDSLRDEYRERLVRIMDESKPFLNPLISLADLASQARIPAHHLSQVLNTCFKQNFFDFINAYRIRESRRLLASADARSRTILDILLETGFNSKSVFNTAFKKNTGLTPSEYKRTLESGGAAPPA